MDRKDLKIQALTEDKNNLSTLVLDLRVELTVLTKELEDARNRLESYEGKSEEPDAWVEEASA